MLPHHVPTFLMKQKITLMVNRYSIIEANPDGSEGRLLAFAQQKRMSFKEKVTFYTDESRNTELFTFKARHGLDVRAEHDVFDEQGQAVGWFKKHFGLSLLRSTWTVEYAGVKAMGQERNQFVAILRRIWDFIPVLGGRLGPFHLPFRLRRRGHGFGGDDQRTETDVAGQVCDHRARPTDGLPGGGFGCGCSRRFPESLARFRLGPIGARVLEFSSRKTVPRP